MLPTLNLPPASLDIKSDKSGRQLVFDTLRGKWIVLTPEEWVRQNFIHALISEKGYSRHSMANEISLTLNNTARRCDTLVFDRQRQPLMVIEYKAPHIPVTQQVFDQIVRYNMVLHARFLTVSNGMAHYCCEIDYTKNTYRYLTDIPLYTEIMSGL